MIDPTFAKLRDLLLNEFSEAEVIALCQDLGLDYETLPGTGFFGKTRGLLAVASKEGRMRALQARVRDARPEAYDSLEIGMASAEEAGHDVSHETSRPMARLPVSFIPMLIVGLIAVALIGVFLLPRITGASAAAAAARATQTAIAALSTNTTIPVIGSAAQPAPSTPTAMPAEGVVVVATEALPIVTAGPAIAVIATQEPVVLGDAHPASTAFKDINARLPAYYRGEVTREQLGLDWRGKALQALTSFSATQLPRSMSLGTASRSTLDISFEYLRVPTVTKSVGSRHTVVTEEYWQYANPANNIKLCDTREYTYSVLEENGRFVVTDLSSKVIARGCR